MALFPLGVKVELLINGAWADISGFVYQRDTIQITGGRTNWGDSLTPAQATLTVNNRDGRFTPNNTSGAYYPYLQRNVKLRISVSDTSSSGNVYAGFRFLGEVHEWPPLSDTGGDDVYVSITAHGPLRRIRRHGGKGSALTRYYASLTGSYAPIAYWPCEEDPDTSIVGAGIEGGTDMTVTVGTPKWKAVSDFNGSAPIGVMNKSTWDGLTGAFGTSGNDIYDAPGSYTWVAPVSSVEVRCWGPGDRGTDPVGNQGGDGGGGGEFAKNTTLAVTVGNSYSFTVPAGNSQTDASFAGDAATVTAHAAVGRTGGSGSTAPTHFSGGTGGLGNSSAAGGGGASSAGTAAAGNNGGNASGLVGGAGGAAVTGGGAGGRGTDGTAFGSNGNLPGAAPGGGGGGGGRNITGLTGANGSSGKIQLIYTPTSVPTNNVLRFIMFVPKHGGNDGKVLVRMLTGGTIVQLDVVHVNTGLIQLKGYTAGPVLAFTSSTVSAPNNQTLMVSAELAPSGANVAYKLATIKPGDDSLLDSTTGTQNTATLGGISEVIAGPNADITKTAIGHISVQYALIGLTRVSKALHGHHTEMGIDRFVRLASEAALDAAQIEFSEADDHWGFEAGTQSWVGTNCALTNPTTTFTPTGDNNPTIWPGWPPFGTHSLLMTANGAGQPTATSPVGTSGRPVLPGDTVSVNAEFYAVATHSNVFVGIRWYNAAGTFLSENDSADTVVSAGTMATVKVKAVAPATSAFFAVKVGNHNTDANGTLLYCDNVRTHPRMGPQTRKELHKFLEEIEDLDQGILKEARELWGFKYRTRFRLINQTPALTLDYSAGMVSPPLAPVIDDAKIKNDVTVHRHKGGRRRRTAGIGFGNSSVSEPPAGVGRHKHHLKVIAEEDAQLAALVAHLLTLGTALDERYPTITVNLARAGIVNNAVAPLMSAVAGVEIGDYVQITNLPFWFPSTTAKQLVIGYTEEINAYSWVITWNCTPEAPYEITQVRRW